MRIFNDRHPDGFSLAETLATVAIGAATLVAVLMVYRRVEDSAEAVNARLDEARIPTEVLQRITEDLDKVISTGPDTTITIQNGFDKGLPKAKLTILKTFTDAEQAEQILDEVTWIAGYDYDRDNGTMILYRGHTGLSYEDKLLDSQRGEWEASYPLIPICAGVTYFRIEVPRGEDNFQDNWESPSLPPGVRVSLSFAEPYETVTGNMDVEETDIYRRTIAIDRTRKIQFELAPDVTVGGDVNEPAGPEEEEITEEEAAEEKGETGEQADPSGALDKEALDEKLRNEAGTTNTSRDE